MISEQLGPVSLRQLYSQFKCDGNFNNSDLSSLCQIFSFSCIFCQNWAKFVWINSCTFWGLGINLQEFNCLNLTALRHALVSWIIYHHHGILFHWFCKCTPPWMFLPLDIPSEYRPEHVTFGLLCVIFKFPSRIFCRRVPGFATDCPCGVWCRGLTTCLLYVGPPLEF